MLFSKKGNDMPLYRNALPQLDGSLFLTDAGLETDLIFNHGIEIRAFAAHTLLPDPQAMALVERYFEGFLALAADLNTGFILDTVTWRAHSHWSAELGETAAELREANERAVAFAAGLREKSANARPIVLNGVIGPRGDAYRPDRRISADDAERYYAEQLGWLAATEVDMVTALTFNQAGEAVGLVQAARAAGLPVVVSFTVETDGRLPDGQPLDEAIALVDAETAGGAAYFMVNCAHPDHFADELGGAWAQRIRGIRANASRRSHAELDEASELDAGDPDELGKDYAELLRRLPWLNVFGACCGADLRHGNSIARSVIHQPAFGSPAAAPRRITA
jgi:S-methylmethionine-dependent homocysteine/selenocysteine methylase